MCETLCLFAWWKNGVKVQILVPGGQCSTLGHKFVAAVEAVPGSQCNIGRGNSSFNIRSNACCDPDSTLATTTFSVSNNYLESVWKRDQVPTLVGTHAQTHVLAFFTACSKIMFDTVWTWIARSVWNIVNQCMHRPSYRNIKNINFTTASAM